MNIWTLPELANASGVPYRTLHAWMHRGLLTASVRETNGTGNPALFSDDDLLRACMIGALRGLLTIEAIEIVLGP